MSDSQSSQSSFNLEETTLKGILKKQIHARKDKKPKNKYLKYIATPLLHLMISDKPDKPEKKRHKPEKKRLKKKVIYSDDDEESQGKIQNNKSDDDDFLTAFVNDLTGSKTKKSQDNKSNDSLTDEGDQQTSQSQQKIKKRIKDIKKEIFRVSESLEENKNDQNLKMQYSKLNSEKFELIKKLSIIQNKNLSPQDVTNQKKDVGKLLKKYDKMDQKTKKELLQRRKKVQTRIVELSDKYQKNQQQFTANDKVQLDNLSDERKQLDDKIFVDDYMSNTDATDTFIYTLDDIPIHLDLIMVNLITELLENNHILEFNLLDYVDNDFDDSHNTEMEYNINETFNLTFNAEADNREQGLQDEQLQDLTYIGSNADHPRDDPKLKPYRKYFEEISAFLKIYNNIIMLCYIILKWKTNDKNQKEEAEEDITMLLENVNDERPNTKYTYSKNAKFENSYTFVKDILDEFYEYTNKKFDNNNNDIKKESILYLLENFNYNKNNIGALNEFVLSKLMTKSEDEVDEDQQQQEEQQNQRQKRKRLSKRQQGTTGRCKSRQVSEKEYNRLKQKYGDIFETHIAVKNRGKGAVGYRQNYVKVKNYNNKGYCLTYEEEEILKGLTGRQYQQKLKQYQEFKTVDDGEEKVRCKPITVSQEEYDRLKAQYPKFVFDSKIKVKRGKGNVLKVKTADYNGKGICVTHDERRRLIASKDPDQIKKILQRAKNRTVSQLQQQQQSQSGSVSQRQLQSQSQSQRQLQSQSQSQQQMRRKIKEMRMKVAQKANQIKQVNKKLGSEKKSGSATRKKCARRKGITTRVLRKIESKSLGNVPRNLCLTEDEIKEAKKLKKNSVLLKKFFQDIRAEHGQGFHPTKEKKVGSGEKKKRLRKKKIQSSDDTQQNRKKTQQMRRKINEAMKKIQQQNAKLKQNQLLLKKKRQAQKQNQKQAQKGQAQKKQKQMQIIQLLSDSQYDDKSVLSDVSDVSL